MERLGVKKVRKGEQQRTGGDGDRRERGRAPPPELQLLDPPAMICTTYERHAREERTHSPFNQRELYWTVRRCLDGPSAR